MGLQVRVVFKGLLSGLEKLFKGLLGVSTTPIGVPMDQLGVPMVGITRTPLIPFWIAPAHPWILPPPDV